MTAYSEIEDLLLGDLAKPENTECAKYIQDAADEIDSKLGFIYVTPIVADPALYRATNLLLKRINNWLASGRLILAMAASDEGQYQNAYAKSLVEQATLALDQLANGSTPLPGATLVNPTASPATGPIVNNIDAQSNVESFYNFVTTPPSHYPYPYPYSPGTIFPGAN